MEEITNNILCCDLCSFSALYVSCAPHTASTLHSLVSANTHSKIVSRKLRHHISVYLNFLIFRTNHNSNSFINYHLQSVRQKKQILCPNSGASWVASQCIRNLDPKQKAGCCCRSRQPACRNVSLGLQCHFQQWSGAQLWTSNISPWFFPSLWTGIPVGLMLTNRDVLKLTQLARESCA